MREFLIFKVSYSIIIYLRFLVKFSINYNIFLNLKIVDDEEFSNGFFSSQNFILYIFFLVVWSFFFFLRLQNISEHIFLWNFFFYACDLMTVLLLWLQRENTFFYWKTNFIQCVFFTLLLYILHTELLFSESGQIIFLI